jgi:hypothetical protein
MLATGRRDYRNLPLAFYLKCGIIYFKFTLGQFTAEQIIDDDSLDDVLFL